MKAVQTQVNNAKDFQDTEGYEVTPDGYVRWEVGDLLDEHDKRLASTPIDPYHYSAFAIEPLDYIMSNGMGFADGNIVKYVTRFAVTGNVTDLKKAKKYIEVMIERAESE